MERDAPQKMHDTGHTLQDEKVLSRLLVNDGSG